MKTSFKYLQKMFFLLAMGFTICAVQACSDDDPVDEGQSGSGRKIAKIAVESEWDEYTHTFSCDDKGQLIKATYVEGDYDFTYQYNWGDGIIRQIGDDNGTFTLENGLIQQGHCSSFYDIDLTYNTSKKFVRLETDYDSYTAIWDGNKLMSISSEERDNTFMYDGKTCKGFLPACTAMFYMDTYAEFLFTAHPEIAGMWTNQLPSARICNGEKYTFTYEFDKKGYVTKIIEKNEDDETETLYLTWQ